MVHVIFCWSSQLESSIKVHDYMLILGRITASSRIVP